MSNDLRLEPGKSRNLSSPANPGRSPRGRKPFSLALLFSCCLVFTLFSGIASGLGQTLTYHIEGIITDVREDVTTFESGKTFDIYYSVDLSAPDEDSDPTRGDYTTAVLSFSFDYDDGSYIGVANSARISVSDATGPIGGDTFSLILRDTATEDFPKIDGQPVTWFGMSFSPNGWISNIFTNDSLDQNLDDPRLAVRFVSFEDATGAIVFRGSMGSVTVVPEPSSGLLLLSATPFLLRRRVLHPWSLERTIV